MRSVQWGLKLGEHAGAPPIILMGEQLLPPAPPVLAPMCNVTHIATHKHEKLSRLALPTSLCSDRLIHLSYRFLHSFNFTLHR